MLQLTPDPIVVKGVLLFLTESGATVQRFQAQIFDYILCCGLMSDAPATYFLPNTALCCLQSFLRRTKLASSQVQQLYALAPRVLIRVSAEEAERWLDCLTVAIENLQDRERIEALEALARLAGLDGNEATLSGDLRILTCVLKTARPSMETYQALEPYLMRAAALCQHCFSVSILVPSSAYFIKTLFWVLGNLVKRSFAGLADSLLNSPSFSQLPVIEALSAGINALGREEECKSWLQVHLSQLLVQLIDTLGATEDYQVAEAVFLVLTHSLWSAPSMFTEAVIRDTFHACEILFHRLNSRNSHDAVISYLSALYGSPLAPEALTADLTQLLLNQLTILNPHVHSKAAALVADIRARYPSALQTGVTQARQRGLLSSLSLSAQVLVEKHLLTASCPAGQLKALIAALSLVLTRRNTEELLFQLTL